MGGALYAIEGLTPAAVDDVARAAAVIPTEASAQAVRCARGEVGATTIRGGRRTVHLSPFGAAIVYFDPAGALESAAPLAQEVLDARDLDEAQERLHQPRRANGTGLRARCRRPMRPDFP